MLHQHAGNRRSKGCSAKVVDAGFDVKLLEFGEESALANTWAEHKLLVRNDDLEQVEALLE